MDTVGRDPSIVDLVADGIMDAELSALSWLLVEARVPLTVIGAASRESRERVARALLGVPPDAPWLLMDADHERPGLTSLGARIRGGVRVGISLHALDLRDALDRLSAPPDGLPEDAVRRLGVVLVVADVPTTSVGPVSDRVRVLAAHYLRPTERDPEGHVQRRPPAVLATWVAEADAFDHFAWGLTPELADLVDRTQASFEELQSSRAAALRDACHEPAVGCGGCPAGGAGRRAATPTGAAALPALGFPGAQPPDRPACPLTWQVSRCRCEAATPRGGRLAAGPHRIPEDSMDQSAAQSRPATLGALRASGYRPRSVKQELRANLLAALAADEPVFPRIVGYEQSVIPAIQNAIIAGHDFVLLGERGQAKTRLARSLVDLLDDAIPVVAGSELNEDPLHPILAVTRERIAAEGDATPIDWLPRDRRYGEKLATPDITIADLIGEVDPIKVAEGRYLSDVSTIAYGLIPRTNRGIFTLNELPDLAERIQVGLLNVLEERDVQVRGHSLRLALDLLFVASANPEDYTSRGRIITPLKDRLGSQVRTHYPRTIEHELRIMDQERTRFGDDDVVMAEPDFMLEIVAELSHLARRASEVSQRSGVSVRVSVSNLETLTANAMRRAVRLGERSAAPRVSDLGALVPSTIGKLELESLSDQVPEERVVDRLLMRAVHDVFGRRVDIDSLAEVVEAFESGLVFRTGESVPSRDYVQAMRETQGLSERRRSTWRG